MNNAGKGVLNFGYSSSKIDLLENCLMIEEEEVPLKIDLNEDEYKTLEKIAKNRGMDIEEFLNHVLSKHSSF